MSRPGPTTSVYEDVTGALPDIGNAFKNAASGVMDFMQDQPGLGKWVTFGLGFLGAYNISGAFGGEMFKKLGMFGGLAKWGIGIAAGMAASGYFVDWANEANQNDAENPLPDRMAEAGLPTGITREERIANERAADAAVRREIYPQVLDRAVRERALSEEFQPNASGESAPGDAETQPNQGVELDGDGLPTDPTEQQPQPQQTVNPGMDI
jgi:hypothetical protein